jgi:hypothetical protein
MTREPLDHLGFVLVADIYRERADPRHILVCFSVDGGRTMQRHLLQSSRVPVSMASVQECLSKIVSRLVEGSVFNDASPPGTAAPVQEPESAPETR